ncbi:hypothetical protein [Faecalicatena contorta]|uniref:hypothetical protein n=1 Tax=Faecalicatena contorta TaxID=39482 RepID=UPI001F1F1C3B|nr:hypothetical protein [Faecalicatena contorta]MCF2554381.1 hypothetical protein [Faecalicatena contorta]
MSKNSYYNHIIQSIMRQEGAESRNPVDIGIECGYPENDVINALKYVQKMEDEKDKSNLLYFSEGANIVSVNTYGWTVEFVKKIKGGVLSTIKVQKNIVINIDSERQNINWDNLKTGESGKIKMDERIKDAVIVQDGIVVFDGAIITKAYFNGMRKDIYIQDWSEDAILKDVSGDIYVIGKNSIWRVDKEINKVKKTAEWGDSIIKCLYRNPKGKYCYVKERSGKYKNYTLDGDVEEDVFSKKYIESAKFYEKNQLNICEIAETKNFYFTGEMIYNKKTNEEKEISSIHPKFNPFDGFQQDRDKKKQMCTLYERDIVLCVCKDTILAIADLEKGQTYYMSLQ